MGKLKSLMQEMIEYLQNQPEQSDAAYTLDLMYKYAVSREFAINIINEWRKQNASN